MKISSIQNTSFQQSIFRRIKDKHKVKQNRTSNLSVTDSPIHKSNNSLNVQMSDEFIPSSDSNKGVEFGMRIYDLLNEGQEKETILKGLKKEYPGVVFSSFDNMKIDGHMPLHFHTAAFAIDIGPKFNAKKGVMYLNTKADTNSDMGKIFFALDSAHEFTHSTKKQEDETIRTLKEISDDYIYAMSIVAIAQYLFGKIQNNYLNTFISAAFGKIDSFDAYYNHGRYIPKERNVSKDGVLMDNYCRSEAQFSESINRFFDSKFDSFIESLLGGYVVIDNKRGEALLQAASDEEGIEKLKADLKKYCAHIAKSEKEAKLVEAKTARKILETDKSINYDIYPICYDLLYNALSGE